MKDLTHASAGALVGAAVCLAAGCPVVGAVVGGIAAMIPDLDMPTSGIGRRFPYLSSLIHGAFGHRKHFHTVYACAAISLLLSMIVVGLCFIFFNSSVVVFYALLACTLVSMLLGHLGLDMATRSGLQPLHPYGPHFKWFFSDEHRHWESIMTVGFIALTIIVCIVHL